MKKSGVKNKSVSKQNSNNKKLVVGILIGLILGLFIGGSFNITGNAIGDICSDDNDGDGFEGPDGDGSDCNDNDANVYPGGWEQCGDSLDNDCDSSTPDTCPTGEICSAGACMVDPNAGTTPPVQTGGCAFDSDCSTGETCSGGICMPTDNDFDGYDVTTDCNDNDANVYPGNWEQCGDSLDNDCDSSTPDTCDPGFTCSAGTCMDDTTGGTTPPV